MSSEYSTHSNKAIMYSLPTINILHILGIAVCKDVYIIEKMPDVGVHVSEWWSCSAYINICVIDMGGHLSIQTCAYPIEEDYTGGLLLEKCFAVCRYVPRQTRM